MPALARRRFVLAGLLLAVVLPVLSAFPVAAIAPGMAAFEATWGRVDQPVAAGRAARTWVWGPAAFSAPMQEWYDESPGGVRVVQYFDKSRMEITDPAADPGGDWYVTNGLLVVELVSGRVQTGHERFIERTPAQVNVAGDSDDPDGPTYQTVAGLRDEPPLADGAPITQRVDRAGVVTDDPVLAAHGVTAAYLVDVPGIRHQVAAPFWTFMNGAGTVYIEGQYREAALFANPFYATGYPITEAYWARVRLGGVAHDVLLQCFERRCLTYTPSNPVEWRVEMGNVGRHYFTWRYGMEIPTEPLPPDINHADPLGPTPLDEWPVDHDGLTRLRMANMTPYVMRIEFAGPTTITMTIPTCPACVIYPPAELPADCLADLPAEEARVPPGNYRVQVTFLGSPAGTDRIGGPWTLVPDATIDTCWVIVERSDG